MSVYMKIDNISGDVSAKGHQGWIALKAAHINMHRPTTVVVGRTESRHTGNLSFSQFTIKKFVDSSSNDLFQNACHAHSLGHVEIDVCTSDSDMTPLVKYILHDAIVSKFETAIGSLGLPMENIQLHFTKLEHHFIGRDSKNRVKSPKRAGYDLTTGQTL